MYLAHIYTEMNPNNFGHIIAYLTLVYKVVDSLRKEHFMKLWENLFKT